MVITDLGRMPIDTQSGVMVLPRCASGVRASVDILHLDPVFNRIEIKILVDNHDGDGWKLLGKCDRLPGPLHMDRQGHPVDVMTCEVRFREPSGADGTESIQAHVTVNGLPLMTAVTVEAL